MFCLPRDVLVPRDLLLLAVAAGVAAGRGLGLGSSGALDVSGSRLQVGMVSKTGR